MNVFVILSFFFSALKSLFKIRKCNALDSDDTKTEFLLALNRKRPTVIRDVESGEFAFRTSRCASAKEPTGEMHFMFNSTDVQGR